MAPTRTEVTEHDINVNLKAGAKTNQTKFTHLSAPLRMVDYVWYAMMYLTFALVGGWYYMTYFAVKQQ
tara:strand:- start:402 stop:605 length:204 start_codon:yes stop_codon:yes gene_type:complete